MSVESEACSGRPFASQNKEVIEKVRQIVMENHHLTLRKIVEEVGISRGSVHSILTEDLCMQRVSVKFIPELLLEQQKELHVEIAQDMLDCANNDLEFMKTIITGDETSVYMVTIQKQVSIFTIEASGITKAQKSMTSSQQCKNNADLFF